MDLRARRLTQHCADCAEALPVAAGAMSGSPAVVAFGTYELDAATKARHGELLLMEVLAEPLEGEERAEAAGEAAGDAACALRAVASHPLPGVFDVKWSACDEWLGAATADGRCYFRKGLAPDAALVSAAVADVPVAVAADAGAAGSSISTSSPSSPSSPSSECFCLSLDWNNRVTRSMSDAKVAVSRSDGRASVLRAGEGGEFALDASWAAHEYPGGSPAEVWIAAFDCFDVNVVLTGADDAMMKLWDLRVDVAGGPLAASRAHEAGVCSAQFHPTRQHVFATGSYDSKIRIWDRRRLRAPVAEPVDTDGGVWRLKWHPEQENRLLAACMRSGFVVLDVDIREDGASQKLSAQLLHAHTEGYGPGKWEALGYGCDWVLPTQSLPPCIATASFYDKTISVLQLP